jgi:hypothetical protein
MKMADTAALINQIGGLEPFPTLSLYFNADIDKWSFV